MNEDYNDFDSVVREEEIEIPEIGEKGLIGSGITNRKLILVLSAVLIVILIAVFTWFFFLKDPMALKVAMRNMKTNAEQLEDPVFSQIDPGLVIDRLNEGRVDAEYSLNISGLEQVPVTIGLDGTLKRDAVNRVMSAENKVSVMNQNIASLSVYAENNTVMFQIPELFDTSFLIHADTIGKDWNSSVFSSLLNTTVSQDLQIDLFPKQESSLPVDLASGWKKNKEEILEILTGEATLEGRSQKCELTILEQEAIECRHYKVRYSKEDVDKILSLLKSGNDYAIDGDVCLDIYCSKNGNVVRISSAEPILISQTSAGNSMKMEFDGNFYGEENSFDQVIAHLFLDDDTATTLEFFRKVNEGDRAYQIGLLEKRGSGLDYQESYYAGTVNTNEEDQHFDVVLSEKMGANATENSEDLASISMSGTITQSDESTLEVALEKITAQGEGIPSGKVSGTIRADLNALQNGTAITSFDDMNAAINPFDLSTFDLLAMATDLVSRYKGMFDSLGVLGSLGLF